MGKGKGRIIDIKTHEERTSEQLCPRSKLGPQGEGAVLSGRLVDS